jgi:hypothetical protein
MGWAEGGLGVTGRGAVSSEAGETRLGHTAGAPLPPAPAPRLLAAMPLPAAAAAAAAAADGAAARRGPGRRRASAAHRRPPGSTGSLAHPSSTREPPREGALVGSTGSGPPSSSTGARGIRSSDATVAMAAADVRPPGWSSQRDGRLGKKGSGGNRVLGQARSVRWLG